MGAPPADAEAPAGCVACWCADVVDDFDCCCSCAAPPAAAAELAADGAECLLLPVLDVLAGVRPLRRFWAGAEVEAAASSLSKRFGRLPRCDMASRVTHTRCLAHTRA